MDFDAFKLQIEERIASQRPQWSKAQQTDLTTLIVTELTTRMPQRLSVSGASNLLEYLEYDLGRIGVGKAPDEQAIKVTSEYFRWAIAEYAARKEMSDAQVAELEAGIKVCFLRAVKILKNEVPSSMHDEIDHIAATNLTYTLRSIHDPLFPGLKRPLDSEDYERSLQEVEGLLRHHQRQREQVEQFRERARQLARQAGATNAPSDLPWSDDLVKVRIESAFLTLRDQLEYRRLTLPEALQRATAEVGAKHREQFEEKRACFMNLRNFGFALRLHASGKEQEIAQRAGSFLTDTNFLAQSQVRWRFSRDGIYPACRLSPTNEIHSYDGLQTTNQVLSDSSPIAWEKKPYHDNQRHVLFFDSHVELVPEEKFQALTNSTSANK